MRRLNCFHSNHVEMESLKQVATIFVEKNLGVSCTSNQYKNPGYLLQISYLRNFTEQTPITQYQDFTDTLPVHFREPALGLFNQAVAYAQNLSIAHHPSSDAASLQADSMITETTPILPVVSVKPLQWIKIDTQLNPGKEVLNYKVVSHFTKELKLKTPNQMALQLYQLVLEVGNLHPNPSLPLLKKFIDSRSSLRASRHLFSQYLNTFCKCLIHCHGSDIDRFNHFHENFEPHQFHKKGGCVGCSHKKL
jgi:hypothetical protein